MDRVDYQSIIVQDLVNIEKSDELDLSPWYQRRQVWNPAQKSYLINTLFERKPIPAIYIRHSLDLEKGKSIKEIVDGQQRTRTILSYCKDEFVAKHPNHDRKIRFSQLNGNQRESFLLTSIPVGYLLGATDADVIEIFGRINSVSKSLNAQEKRNAGYSGEFKQFCLKEASSRINFWRTYNIFTANEIACMNEFQFISDTIINMIEGLTDFSARKIDQYYKNYDDEFEKSSEIQSRLDRIFDFLSSIDKSSITDTIFKRQPVFFSLFIVLDILENLDRTHIEQAIYEIDLRFNSEENKEIGDIEFYNACTATTQRIAQRKTRDNYIRKYI